MKTKIINDTTHEFKVQEANGGVYRDIFRLPPKKEFTLRSDPHTTYHEYVFKLLEGIGKRSILISSDHCVDFEEITIYETLSHAVEIRMSKVRRRSLANSQPENSRSNTEQPIFINTSTVTRDLAAFHALREDASLRIEAIETSCASLKELLKQVKVCSTQCQNLVGTCLEGIKQMKEDYFVVSENDMYVWQLYYSKKLKQLMSSLDRLLSTLWSVIDLLKACGSQWGKMGLVLSIPLPPSEERTYSKFDVLIKELSWNLDTIHYALDLRGDMELKWNENRCTYVLEKDLVLEDATAGVVKLVESKTLVQEDRNNFLAHLQDGSLLTPKNFFRRLAWQHLSWRSGADRLRQYFAAGLEKRLQEISPLPNESSLVPDCFWINHLDLKIRNTLSGENSMKGIYRGKWCGQVVAIGITKGTTRAAIEREAAVMLKVQHPNIVDFFGCAFTDNAPPSVSGGIDDICTAGYLVMELMQEDLRRVIDLRVRIQSGSPFPLPVAVDILLQIAAAMIHMHNRDIIHRDLKAANCLVSPRSTLKSNSQVFDLYTVKLIDFGNSKRLNSDDSISNHTSNSGTRRWMAPEVWGTPGVILAPYKKSADVYSFGMICYEVVTGLLPFHDCVYNSDLQLLIHEGKRPLFPASVSCPEGLKDLMSKCWDQEPSARPNFKDIEKALWTIKYELELQ